MFLCDLFQSMRGKSKSSHDLLDDEKLSAQPALHAKKRRTSDISDEVGASFCCCSFSTISPGTIQLSMFAGHLEFQQCFQFEVVKSLK